MLNFAKFCRNENEKKYIFQNKCVNVCVILAVNKLKVT